MTPMERVNCAETVGILRALGGEECFKGLAPPLKATLLKKANELEAIILRENEEAVKECK